MKILHVVQSLALGGQEVLLVRLARSLRARGHEVVVVPLVPGGALEASFEPGIVKPVPRREGRDPLLALRLAAVVRAERPDVVHTHNDSPMVYGAPAAWLAGVRTVVHTKHGAKAPARNHALRAMLARGLRAYVGVSAETSERAVRDLGIPAAKVVTIPNGIPTREFGPDPAARAAVRSAFGIAADAFVVGTLGRLEPEKNPQLLLAAMEPILAAGAHLIFVGDGSERSALAAAIARRGTPRVHLTGARDDAPRLLAALDLFALSSRIEGLPLALVEAMATALPIVATDVGGIREATGATAAIVPPNDEAALREAIEALRDDAPRRASMGAEARLRAQAVYDFERVVDRYLDLYRG
jgi:glycosyltransferase involved in cell wall biosynthesis